MSNAVYRKALGPGRAAMVMAVTVPGAYAAPGSTPLATLTATAGDLSLASSNSVGLTVQANTGYVGVGTAVPRAALDVSGNVAVSGTVTADTLAFTTMTANTGTISGVAHLTTIMGTGISDSLVLASSTTAASAAAVSNCWAGCVHTSGGVVSGTLGVSNLNVLGNFMTVNATEVVSSNLNVVNYGTGPALSVTQSETGVFGAQPVATFVAGSNVGLVVTNSGGVAVGKSTASYALDVSGVVSATSFVGSGALLTGISSGGSGAGMFKNLVINGDMQINQYWVAWYPALSVYINIHGQWLGTSTIWDEAMSPTGTIPVCSTGSTQATSCYVVDRFCVYRDGYTAGVCTQGWNNVAFNGIVDLSQAASMLPFTDAGIYYYIMMGRNAGDSTTANINMRYAFELMDSAPIYSKTVTLSFYYQCGANFSGSNINYGLIMGAGEGLQRGAVTVTNTQGTTASPSSSWVRVSFTTTLPVVTSSNQYLGLYFYYTPSGTAGDNDYVSITGVQLEKGSSATTFEYCPFATKLSLCQRYCKPLIGIMPSGSYIYVQGTMMLTFFIKTGTMRVSQANMTLRLPTQVTTVVQASSPGSVTLSSIAFQTLWNNTQYQSDHVILTGTTTLSGYTGPIYLGTNSKYPIIISAEM